MSEINAVVQNEVPATQVAAQAAKPAKAAKQAKPAKAKPQKLGDFRAMFGHSEKPASAVQGKPAKAAAQQSKAAKPAKAAAQQGKRNCSTVARALILEGKTNAEVWAVIKDEFKLSDNKKHYPAWYRSEQKRAGNLK